VFPAHHPRSSPTPPLWGLGSMDREERPDQHHPSPHRGVKGSRRANVDQVTSPQPRPPTSPSGVVGRSSWQAGTQQLNSPPLHAPSSTVHKRPLPHHQLMPLPSINGMSQWDVKRGSQLKILPVARKSASSAVSPTRLLQAHSPPVPFLLDDARINETMASLPFARQAFKQSRFHNTAATPILPCVATHPCPILLSVSATAGKKKRQAPLQA
jgi:hypothetical protein